MAFKPGGDEDEMVETHDINVTPFIDVVLVLLIVFMVAAPLATVDVPVDLPVSTAQPQPRPEQPVYLTLRADYSLLLGENPVAREALGAALDGATGADHERRIFLRADAAVPYGELTETMNLLRAAGYLRLALVGLDAGQRP